MKKRKYKVYYFLNKDNEFIESKRVKKRLIVKLNNYRIFSDGRIIFVRIPSKFFPDSRDTAESYYFSISPGVPLYIFYKEYQTQLDIPDPVYGGKISMYNTNYQEVRDFTLNRILEFSVFLELVTSFLSHTPMFLNPIAMRYLWELERIAYDEYNIVFTYCTPWRQEDFVKLCNKADIIFRPIPITAGENHYKYRLQILSHASTIMRHIKLLRGKSAKHRFFKDVGQTYIEDNVYEDVNKYLLTIIKSYNSNDYKPPRIVPKNLIKVKKEKEVW